MVDFLAGAVFLQISAKDKTVQSQFEGLSVTAVRLTYTDVGPPYVKPSYCRVHGLGGLQTSPVVSGLNYTPPIINERVYGIHRVDTDPVSKLNTVTDLGKLKGNEITSWSPEEAVTNNIFVYDSARQLIFKWGAFTVAVPVAQVPVGTILYNCFGNWDLLTYDRTQTTDKSLPSNSVVPIRWYQKTVVDRGQNLEFLNTEPRQGDKDEWVAEVIVEQLSTTPDFSAFIIDFGLDGNGVPLVGSVHIPRVQLIETPRIVAGADDNVVRIAEEKDPNHPNHNTVVFWDRDRGLENYTWTKNSTTGVVQRDIVAPQALAYTVGDWLNNKDKALGRKITITTEALPRAWSSTQIEGWQAAAAHETKMSLINASSAHENQGRLVFEIVPGTVSAVSDIFYEWNHGPLTSKPVVVTLDKVLAPHFPGANPPLILVRKPGYSNLYKPVTAVAGYLSRLLPKDKKLVRESVIPTSLEPVYGAVPRRDETTEQRTQRLKEANAKNPYPTLGTSGPNGRSTQADRDVFDTKLKAWQKIANDGPVTYTPIEDGVLNKSNVGHSYTGLHPVSKQLKLLTNHTGLAYNVDGSLVPVKIPQSTTPGGKEPGSQAGSGADIANKTAATMAACLSKPDNRGEQSKQYAQMMAASNKYIQPECKYNPTFDTLKTKVDGSYGPIIPIAKVKYTKDNAPYLKSLSMSGCDTVSATAFRGATDRNRSVCNLSVSRNTVGVSQTAVSEIKMTNIKISGECCAPITATNDINQVLTINQNLTAKNSASILDSMTATNALTLNYDNFQKTKIDIKGDPGPGSASSLQLAGIPKPGPKNVQSSFNSAVNNENYLQFVENSAAVNASQAASAVLTLDGFECTANRRLIKNWEYVVNPVDPNKSELKLQERLSPCEEGARINFTNKINQTLDVSQIINSTIDYSLISNFKTKTDSDVKIKNTQIGEVKVDNPPNPPSRAGFAGLLGGYASFFIVVMVILVLRARNMFILSLIDPVRYKKLNLKSLNLEYEYNLWTLPVAGSVPPSTHAKKIYTNTPYELDAGSSDLVNTKRQSVLKTHVTLFNKENPSKKAEAGWKNTLIKDSLLKSVEFKMNSGLTSLFLTGNGTVSGRKYLFPTLICVAVILSAILAIYIKNLFSVGFTIPLVSSVLALPAIFVSFLLAFALGVLFFFYVSSSLLTLLPGIIMTLVIPVIAVLLFMVACIEFLLNAGTNFTMMYVAAITAGVLILTLLGLYVYNAKKAGRAKTASIQAVKI
jgi:hypothetical protein